jgi:hypothetical protein
MPSQYHADSGGSFEIVWLQGEGGQGQGGALMQMSPLYPSLTDWVPDYDPITSLGDCNWTVRVKSLPSRCIWLTAKAAALLDGRCVLAHDEHTSPTFFADTQCHCTHSSRCPSSCFIPSRLSHHFARRFIFVEARRQRPHKRWNLRYEHWRARLCKVTIFMHSPPFFLPQEACAFVNRCSSTAAIVFLSAQI